MTRVAFLGLGAIGAPMARHLAAPPFELLVWNRTREKALTLATGSQTRVAESPAAAARHAEVVVTCLPTSREVEALLDGEDGLLDSLGRGATLVDCTSGDPATSRRIASRLASRGISFLDAPVSGGVKGAVAGTLTVMIGGDPSVVERVRPVLEAFGKTIVHCGPVGAGHALKAMNQYLLGLHIWSLAEALSVLTREGVSAEIALQVINASSGRSNSSQNLFPERVLGRAFHRTFRQALLDKDVRIAASVAREHEIPAPMLQLTAELMHLAHRALGEDADHVETVRYVEQLTGTEIS
ncbi:MAG: NAD(P)-dependent oxidoreductase [Gemmatimonadaceae bacterium]